LTTWRREAPGDLGDSVLERRETPGDLEEVGGTEECSDRLGAVGDLRGDVAVVVVAVTGFFD